MSNRKKTKSNNSNGILLAFMLLGATVVGVLAFYVSSSTPTERNHRAHPVVNQPDREPQISRKDHPRGTTYFLYDPDKKWAEVPIVVSSGEPIKDLVGEFINRSPDTSGLTLLSADLRNGHAVLNFSKSIDGMGSTEEGQFVEGILRILGQFPNVSHVDFLNQGETMETGHDVYENLAVIRPGTVDPPQPESSSNP